MRSKYENPLNSRYSSKEMSYLFSPDFKFKTWRKLWIALAESEKELGLNITDEQIAEMKKYQDDINYDVAEAREKIVRHDVMSHVYAFGTQAKSAMPIIHLGATSCFVGDNTDIIIMTEAMKLVKKGLVNVINELSKFALEYKDMPTLGFTHFQPAQTTTVGKRATLWLQDLLMDLEDLEFQISKAKLRGAKGTTGTQASFMELFDGDTDKVKELDRRVAEKMGYDNLVVSIKSSDVLMCVKAHELIAKACPYPLHVGITESGTVYSGNIKSSIGLGIILNEGIGNTIRVSLTGDPAEEIRSAKLILKTLGLRKGGIEVVSCPTCGRTKIDLIGLANEVEKMVQDIPLDIKVAVMGCVVNGPGEAREADIGIAGGIGEGLLIKKGEIIKKVKEEKLLETLRQELLNWKK